MDIAEYHKMHALESHYWWFQGRRRVILTLLDDLLRARQEPGKPLMLDVGCGTGMLLADLKERGHAIGLDFAPVALQYCRERQLDELGRADVRHLPVRSSTVDVILALDLVEHVPDDVGLLNEFSRVLKPGGTALLSVPAHKNLWSKHDVALHHMRRYERSEFIQLIKDAGLEPVKYSYGVATAYLPAMVYRRIRRTVQSPDTKPSTDEFPLPRLVNTGLRKIMELEARWLRRHSLPFGLSLLCVARKPA